LSGFPFNIFLQDYRFTHIAWRSPYDCYLHRALISWAFCMLAMVSMSLATAAPDALYTERIIRRSRYALLPATEQSHYRGWNDFRIWYLASIVAALSINRFSFRFQFLRRT
jgi:hypothetical protein